jgi:hypothetical protein
MAASFLAWRDAEFPAAAGYNSAGNEFLKILVYAQCQILLRVL